jgi:hypothetical protein
MQMSDGAFNAGVNRVTNETINEALILQGKDL